MSTLTLGRACRTLLDVIITGWTAIMRYRRSAHDHSNERPQHQRTNIIRPYLLYPELEDMPANTDPHTL
jgi:hypothetical protein